MRVTPPNAVAPGRARRRRSGFAKRTLVQRGGLHVFSVKPRAHYRVVSISLA